MNVRPMIITDEVKAGAERLVAYALLHPISVQHLFHLLAHPEDAPGHNPEFVLDIPVGYRCVFTFENQPNGFGWMRHLSMSVDEKGKLPNKFAVAEVMKLFGFQRKLGEALLLVHVMYEELDSVNILEPYEGQLP